MALSVIVRQMPSTRRVSRYPFLSTPGSETPVDLDTSVDMKLKSSLSVTHTRSRSLLLAVLCAGIFLTHPPAYSLREKILFEVPQVHATFWRRRTEMCKNNRTARPCPRRASPRGPGCFRNSVQQDAAAPRCYSPWSPVAGRRARNTPTATPLPGTRSAPLTVTRNSIASTATATHRV